MNSLDDRGGHRVSLVGAGKRYGAVRALAGVDLEVEAGRFLVLLGPSGSGKTTLVRALAGIERLDEGELRIGDRLVSAPRTHVPPEQRDLAMVFQDYALWPHLSALGNVGYALKRRKLAADQSRARAMEALERVGLAGLAERYPHELSGGQQQRVALARAIVAQPGLLLFDEPLSNLDTDLRERLRVEISTLTRQSGATAVYITHDQAEAFALADMIGVLDQGRLVQLADPETLYHRPATPFVAGFTGLSGELTGTVVGREPDDFYVVEVRDWRVQARSAHALKAGDAVRVLIRPAAPAFDESADAADAADAAASSVGSLSGSVSGTVIDVAYRGRGYDHVIACGDRHLTSVFSARPWARGTHARLSLDPTGCIAFPLNDAAQISYDDEVTTVTAGQESAAINQGVTE
ncbi:ABC transporter ATP-binding protein [Actinospica sp. MGRD01-02]|uniref:ABC-type quaternary amine transporter n=1 Tax=Actinospica acidithermotolerans TaxID=2828514 RepID=A0A941E8J4_9ACTN|nr:ABC transporter ATP-binding protein [Actinospica acidithermotolerans]MBR7825888.1 ABC transporter ATP-binding protein [Actinospica acidithermotolerans]